VPWSNFWDQNYFLDWAPSLATILTNNYVRGAVSGLGIVNLFAGFAELAVVFAARDRHHRAAPDTSRQP
jgi:hypothetical protein